MASVGCVQYETLKCFQNNGVAEMQLARPEKSNALNFQCWREIPQAMKRFDESDDVRVVVLTGQGRHFCAGIDLELVAMHSAPDPSGCPGRKAEKLRRQILSMQSSLSALELVRCPVIAAAHGSVIGAGMDMFTACDLRYCTRDARFCVKEVDIGITADMGTLQRLPLLVGDGIARELCFTARTFGADEALSMGLVSQVFPDQSKMREHVLNIAQSLAQKSPLALAGTKRVLLHARDHTVAESLEYVANWNSGQLVSSDLHQSLEAIAQRRQPHYAKL